jgi:hypothetical protein
VLFISCVEPSDKVWNSVRINPFEKHRSAQIAQLQHRCRNAGRECREHFLTRLVFQKIVIDEYEGILVCQQQILNPPSITNRTMASRPFGVRGAFLWLFIWSLRGTLKLRNLSFLGSDQMDNLLKDHS